jgi:hypothetical protein
MGQKRAFVRTDEGGSGMEVDAGTGDMHFEIRGFAKFDALIRAHG